MFNLDRFVSAQNRDYPIAFQEIKTGKKQSHWMWYIFPQLRGLGKSSTAEYYAIVNTDEAGAYIKHPILGKRLIEICELLLSLDSNDAYAIFGNPDDLKEFSGWNVKNKNFFSSDFLDPYFYTILKGSEDNEALKNLGKEIFYKQFYFSLITTQNLGN